MFTFKKLIGVTAVLLATLLLFIALDIYRYSLRDETQPADAAIVLGAAVYDGRPSPIFRERINHAVQLYQDGLVQAIIFTGGVGYGDVLAEGEVGRNYAMARGVPAAAIFIETSSTNTRENLLNARAVAAENDLESFLIVSTPFHMRRAMSLAADLDMEAYTSPTRSVRWFSRLTQARAFSREIVAYIVYLGDITD